MHKIKHEWFVCPKDSHTNEVIARFACQGTFGFDDNTLENVLCEDGKKRNLWRTTEQDAWFLWRSRTDLKFEVFNRLGNGKIRDVTSPLFRKDRRSPKKKAKRRKPVPT
jgi:hypothetical protein